MVHLATSTIVSVITSILAKKNQMYGSFGGYERAFSRPNFPDLSENPSTLIVNAVKYIFLHVKIYRFIATLFVVIFCFASSPYGLCFMVYQKKSMYSML
jgi:hypothetical protein